MTNNLIKIEKEILKVIENNPDFKKSEIYGECCLNENIYLDREKINSDPTIQSRYCEYINDYIEKYGVADVIIGEFDILDCMVDYLYECHKGRK